VPGLGRV